MKALIISWNSLRRLVRDRSNIFFVFIMPMMLILILGAVYGRDYDPRVGVVSEGSGALGADFVERLQEAEGIVVTEWGDADELILDIERGSMDAAVVIPEGYDSDLRAGDDVSIEFVARPSESAIALKNAVDSVATAQGALLRAAGFASDRGAGTFDETLDTAVEVSEQTVGITVEQEVIGEPFVLDTLGQFDLGAYSQLLLFIFLTSMNGSAALIQSRQLGVSERMLSTPTSVGTILLGELGGRFAVALAQGLLIIFGTALVFGVDWGDPLGAAAIFVLFSLGAAGVGMLMGATFKNDQQAGGVGVMLGIGMGALGGCMIPLSIMQLFSPTLYQVAHVTPHAWGVGAYEELILRGGTIADIGLQLSVLGGFAAVVLVLGSWRLRAALTN